MSWYAQAPSNIALIKYMGKRDSATNLPINPSLSYTLNQLQSHVELTQHTGITDTWAPLDRPGCAPMLLGATGQSRFLQHLARIKAHFNYSGHFLVRSSNDFPHGTGLASSASSFAALTRCAVLALSELTQTALPPIEDQATLSRAGSGSSCRSFFSPWALWDDTTIRAIDLPYPTLIHQVILISATEKKISSSDAHQQVKHSPYYATRSLRARENLTALLKALELKDWSKAHSICWNEFQDMHQLFETATPAFTYRTQRSTQALNTLQASWERECDGPLVTMDAGPNIHLLYRPDQAEMAARFKHDHLIGHYEVL